MKPELLPHGASSLRSQDEQVFSIAEGNTKFVLIPITYRSASDDPGWGDRFRCGLYLVSKTNVQFLSTVGPEQDVLQCDGLAAMGTVKDKSPWPAIALVYNVSTPNTHFRSLSIIRWIDGQYREDSITSGWLNERLPQKTLANVRDALRDEIGFH